MKTCAGLPAVIQQTTKCGTSAMAVHKQSVSFTNAAFAFARELVDADEYPNVSAVASGEQALFKAELQRCLTLPVDQ